MEVIKLLDQGYIKLIECWGTGEAGANEPDYEVGIIEAARMSTQKGFQDWHPAECDCGQAEREKSAKAELDKIHNLFISDTKITTPHYAHCSSILYPGDMKLLRYLYANKHATPFEFAGAVFEIQAPIFVFREWHRHRTQSYNEASARYAPLPELFYIPSLERVMMKGGANKQAQGNGDLTEEVAEFFRTQLRDKCISNAQDYAEFLQCGVPKELARCVLPVNWYSKMRVSANLRNWLAFMTLRCDPLAQWEIRQYANALADILMDKFPNTIHLWRMER